MTQSKADPQSPVRVVPDMFGYTLHIQDRRLFISNDELLRVISELAYWLPPGNRDAKRLVERLALNQGILTEDLFPVARDG